MMTAGTLLHLCPWAKSMAAGELILSPKCDAYAKHNPQKTFPDALKDNLNRRSYVDADKKQPLLPTYVVKITRAPALTLRKALSG